MMVSEIVIPCKGLGSDSNLAASFGANGESDSLVRSIAERVIQKTSCSDASDFVTSVISLGFNAIVSWLSSLTNTMTRSAITLLTSVDSKLEHNTGEI